MLLLLAVGFALLRSEEAKVTASGPDDEPTTSLGSTRGPASSVAGTGRLTSITATRAASSLRAEQQQKAPQLTVGAITCPAGTYREGQVVVCEMLLEDATVLYEVAVTGQQSLEFKPTDPVVDTDKAEALMQSKEPGTTADCGSPRVRQLDVGATFTCRSASSTWVFTVTPDGDLFGTKRP